MTMSEFDFSLPAREHRLGDVAADLPGPDADGHGLDDIAAVAEALAELDAGVTEADIWDALEGVFEDLDAAATDEQPSSEAVRHARGVAWAISEFGADATVRVAVPSAADKARVADFAETTLIGDHGDAAIDNLLLARVVDGPWSESCNGLRDAFEVINALDHRFRDWLESEYEAVSRQTPGN